MFDIGKIKKIANVQRKSCINKHKLICFKTYRTIHTTPNKKISSN